MSMIMLFSILILPLIFLSKIFIVSIASSENSDPLLTKQLIVFSENKVAFIYFKIKTVQFYDKFSE